MYFLKAKENGHSAFVTLFSFSIWKKYLTKLFTFFWKYPPSILRHTCIRYVSGVCVCVYFASFSRDICCWPLSISAMFLEARTRVGSPATISFVSVHGQFSWRLIIPCRNVSFSWNSYFHWLNFCARFLCKPEFKRGWVQVQYRTELQIDRELKEARGRNVQNLMEIDSKGR